MNRILTKKRILAAAIAAAAAVALLLGVNALQGETAETEDVQVTSVTMEQTLTAAGEIRASSSKVVDFSTSRTFLGMCVEENEHVDKGQHLIAYADGTYEDAPAEGVITQINAPDTGDTATSSNTLTLDCTKKLALVITVPEDEINTLTVGDEASIVVNSDPSKTYSGRITRITALSDSQLTTASSDSQDETQEMPSGGGSSSGTAYYSVTLKLANDGSLCPGMSASSTITVSSRRSVVAVPVEAVNFDEEGNSYVDLVSGSETVKTEVVTGESDAEYVEITDGLTVGDTVRITS